MKKLVIISFLCCFAVFGCGSELLTGFGIGAGTATGLTEAQKMAAASKAELVAELAITKEKLAQITEPNEIKSLGKQLATLQEKQNVVDAAEQLTNKITEGISKNWQTTNPQKQTENIQWLIGAALGTWALWSKRRQIAAEKTLTRIEGESDPATAKKIYDMHKEYKSKVIAK